MAMMNDTPVKGSARIEQHDLHVLELIEEAGRDLERMRADVGAGEAADLSSWLRVQKGSHNIAARAAALKLRVLEHVARELEAIAAEVLAQGAGQQSDIRARSMRVADVAIETIALELESLRLDIESGS
jgi:hypothetical protein